MRLKLQHDIMNKSNDPFNKKKKERVNLKYDKRWIEPVQISKAVSSIEELSSVLILMRSDNVE